MAPQVAWIGLGNMGRGMCKNTVEKGKLDKPLILYNRTRKRADAFHSTLPPGASIVAESIEQAVEKADLIFTCVGDDVAIRETISAALKVDVKGKLFVDCSTVHPDTTAELDKCITDAGAEFVAMPVFGAPAMADNGQLICVLAGPTNVTEKVTPYTTGVTGRVTLDFSGQAPRQATLLKLIGNTFILSMVETLSEGLVTAEKTGLGVKNLQDLINNLFGGPYAGYCERMVSGDYWKRDEPLFAVDLARKDATHAMELAQRSGARLELAEVADRHLVILKEHAGEGGDIAGIYGAVRKENGLKFENRE